MNPRNTVRTQGIGRYFYYYTNISYTSQEQPLLSPPVWLEKAICLNVLKLFFSSCPFLFSHPSSQSRQGWVLAACQSVLERICLHISHVLSEVRDLVIILQNKPDKKSNCLVFSLTSSRGGATACLGCPFSRLVPGAQSAAAVRAEKAPFQFLRRATVSWVGHT